MPSPKASILFKHLNVRDLLHLPGVVFSIVHGVCEAFPVCVVDHVEVASVVVARIPGFLSEEDVACMCLD